MLVAKELNPWKKKNLERKARAYYSRRKGDVPKELEKNSEYTSEKRRPSVPELPTPMRIFMKEIYNEESANLHVSKNTTNYMITRKVLNVSQQFGVRDMMRRHTILHVLGQSTGC